MASPTTIVSLEVAPLDMALVEPFSIASGAQAVAKNLLVGVVLADGSVGIGEAAPFPAVSGETQESARVTIEACRSLVGRDARALRPISSTLDRLCENQPAARCGIEHAILDAWLRHHRMPMYSYFGGAGTELVTDLTVTAGDRTRSVASARAAVSRGIADLKIKVGAASFAEDAERVIAIHEAVPRARLHLDANGGYTPQAALDLLAILQKRGILIHLFEQPVAATDRAGLLAVAHKTRVPICADESARSVSDVLWLIENSGVSAINIKLMKTGLFESLAIYHIARAAGLRLMIGGMVEGRLAMSVSAHFAAGLGGFSFVDLDTPMFIVDDPFRDGFVQNGATLSIAHVTAGHGVTMRNS